jgi:hypothetical protein
MAATTFPLLEPGRNSTLRERWLRLLRDLYALPDVHFGMMDELIPDRAKTSLVLVRGGAQRDTQKSATRVARPTLRLVVADRGSSEEQVPTQGDGDDIDAPDTPPAPYPPAGDVPPAQRRDGGEGAAQGKPRTRSDEERRPSTVTRKERARAVHRRS